MLPMVARPVDGGGAAIPPKLPRSITEPFCHSVAWRPWRLENVKAAQFPVAPTAWPLSLILKTTPSGSLNGLPFESLPDVGSCWIAPLVQMTGLNWYVEEGHFAGVILPGGGGRLSAVTPYSATPPASPKILIPFATEFLPTTPEASFRGGNGDITPFCQTKAWQTCRLPELSGPVPQKSAKSISTV